MPRLAVLIALFALVWPAEHAFAQEDDTAAHVDLAKRHFQSAGAYFEEGRYDEAAREFLETYRLAAGGGEGARRGGERGGDAGARREGGGEGAGGREDGGTAALVGLEGWMDRGGGGRGAAGLGRGAGGAGGARARRRDPQRAIGG